MTRRALLSWSSGKDAAYALHLVRTAGEIEIVGLLTTTGEETGRVAIHRVRGEVLRAQAAAIGLPLHEVPLPSICPNEVYAARMGEALVRLQAAGVQDVVFGDIHLADVRAYREDRLAAAGMEGHFPLWGRDTGALARDMLAAGLVAHVASLNPAVLPAERAGARFDAAFLEALPEGVDPCGERGEFHTVVSDGPAFRHPLRLLAGEIVHRDGNVYADLALAAED